MPGPGVRDGAVRPGGCAAGRWVLLALVAFVACLAAGLVLAPPASAAPSWVVLDREEGRPLQDRLRAYRVEAPGADRTGALGFVAIRLENPQGEAHDVEVVAEADTDPGATRIARRVRLEPRTGAWLHLPLPSVRAGMVRLEFGVDDRTAFSGGAVASFGPQTVGVLGVHAAEVAPPDALWRPVVGGGVQNSARTGRRGSGPLGIEPWVEAPALPREGRLLTGFDLVLVAVPLAALDPAQQEALVDYVAMGGHLLLAAVRAGDDGPLVRLWDGDLPEAFARGRHGFGSFFALAEDGLARLGVSQQLRSWLAREPLAPLNEDVRPLGGGAPTLFWVPQEIPGLGTVPTRAFFLLLLGFAVVAGPLSYRFFKKRAALAWLVAWVPALGFLAAAAVLLYGLLSEGFGIRGSVRSLTLLDQRTHEAATAAGRTLYAGLSPRALAPRAETFFSPWAYSALRLHDPYDEGPDGRIRGAVLPSRTPTPLLTMQAGTARERLRFRRLDAGGYEILHGPDFAPRDEAGSVLLCDFEGRPFLRDASGRMVPIDPARMAHEVEACRAAIARGSATFDPYRQGRRSRHLYYGGHDDPSLAFWTNAPGSVVAADTEFDAWWRRTVPRSLPQGAYLARVQALPSLDDLGLAVAWDAHTHVVLGFLDPEEDIVE